MTDSLAYIDELHQDSIDVTKKYRDIFDINLIDKNDAYKFVRKYHYLGDARFFNEYSFGLFYKGNIVGVSSFAQPQGYYTTKGWFGNFFCGKEYEVMELQRLAMLPILNGTNATSYLLSNSMKKLKPYGIKVVITLADSCRHVGSIYQVCNFRYFGLTDKKTDFYVEKTGKKVGHGKTKGIRGVYIPRNRKHRYAFLLDKRVPIKYQEEPYPKKKDLLLSSKSGIYKDTRLGCDTYYKYDRESDTIHLIGDSLH